MRRRGGGRGGQKEEREEKGLRAEGERRKKRGGWVRKRKVRRGHSSPGAWHSTFSPATAKAGSAREDLPSLRAARTSKLVPSQPQGSVL